MDPFPGFIDHAHNDYAEAFLELGVPAAHGLFDFNFHIPANAIYFSFLAGVFFFTPAEDPA